MPWILFGQTTSSEKLVSEVVVKGYCPTVDVGFGGVAVFKDVMRGEGIPPEQVPIELIFQLGLAVWSDLGGRC